MNKALLIEIKNFVATVTLNRPEVHNAFNAELIKELSQTFQKLDNDKKVKVIVLTGSGSSFCAGADVNWMKSMVNFTKKENIADSMKMANMFEGINACSKPLIGVVNGHALGGGAGLVSVCDYVIAVPEASFGFTEVRLGLIPAVISPYVIAKIGESNARAWFLSGERFSAKTAYDMHLIHEVADKNILAQQTQKIIESFLKAAPEATQVAKELIQVVTKNLKQTKLKKITCEQIAKRRVSKEGQEGMNSLLEKRKPQWTEK
ncbi:MAG: enoyl-CoA hydratase/isomerase family protein [Bacteriovoracaceae bacterium]|nr:enoyl-CoA hydratase/isomerase family protein [Bacteriovoracaceae bacterium]